MLKTQFFSNFLTNYVKKIIPKKMAYFLSLFLVLGICSTPVFQSCTRENIAILGSKPIPVYTLSFATQIAGEVSTTSTVIDKYWKSTNTSTLQTEIVSFRFLQDYNQPLVLSMPSYIDVSVVSNTCSFASVVVSSACQVVLAFASQEQTGLFAHSVGSFMVGQANNQLASPTGITLYTHVVEKPYLSITGIPFSHSGSNPTVVYQSFGSVSPFTITITNQSTETGISDLSFVLPTQSFVIFNNQCPADLPPEASCNIEVMPNSFATTGTRFVMGTSAYGNNPDFPTESGQNKTISGLFDMYVKVVTAPSIAVNIAGVSTQNSQPSLFYPSNQVAVTKAVITYTNTSTDATAVAYGFTANIPVSGIYSLGANSCQTIANLTQGTSCTIEIFVAGSQTVGDFIQSVGTYAFQDAKQRSVASPASIFPTGVSLYTRTIAVPSFNVSYLSNNWSAATAQRFRVAGDTGVVATYTIRVTNISSSFGTALQFGSTVTDTSFVSIQDNCQLFNLTPGTYCDINVRFRNSSTAGTHSSGANGLGSIYYTDAKNTQYAINLTQAFWVYYVSTPTLTRTVSGISQVQANPTYLEATTASGVKVAEVTLIYTNTSTDPYAYAYNIDSKLTNLTPAFVLNQSLSTCMKHGASIVLTPGTACQVVIDVFGGPIMENPSSQILNAPSFDDGLSVSTFLNSNSLYYQFVSAPSIMVSNTGDVSTTHPVIVYAGTRILGTQTVTFTNTGNDPISNIQTILPVTGGTTAIADGCNDIVGGLPAGQSCDITMQFNISDTTGTWVQKFPGITYTNTLNRQFSKYSFSTVQLEVVSKPTISQTVIGVSTSAASPTNIYTTTGTGTAVQAYIVYTNTNPLPNSTAYNFSVYMADVQPPYTIQNGCQTVQLASGQSCTIAVMVANRTTSGKFALNLGNTYYTDGTSAVTTNTTGVQIYTAYTDKPEVSYAIKSPISMTQSSATVFSPTNSTAVITTATLTFTNNAIGITATAANVVYTVVDSSLVTHSTNCGSVLAPGGSCQVVFGFRSQEAKASFVQMLGHLSFQDGLGQAMNVTPSQSLYYRVATRPTISMSYSLPISPNTLYARFRKTQYPAGSLLTVAVVTYTNTNTDPLDTAIIQGIHYAATSRVSLLDTTCSFGTVLSAGQSCTVRLSVKSAGQSGMYAVTSGSILFSDAGGANTYVAQTVTQFVKLVGDAVIRISVRNVSTNPNAPDQYSIRNTTAAYVTGYIDYTNISTDSTAVAYGFTTNIPNQGIAVQTNHGCSNKELLPMSSTPCSDTIKFIGTTATGLYTYGTAPYGYTDTMGTVFSISTNNTNLYVEVTNAVLTEDIRRSINLSLVDTAPTYIDTTTTTRVTMATAVLTYTNFTKDGTVTLQNFMAHITGGTIFTITSNGCASIPFTKGDACTIGIAIMSTNVSSLFTQILGYTEYDLPSGNHIDNSQATWATQAAFVQTEIPDGLTVQVFGASIDSGNPTQAMATTATSAAITGIYIVYKNMPVQAGGVVSQFTVIYQSSMGYQFVSNSCSSVTLLADEQCTVSIQFMNTTELSTFVHNFGSASWVGQAGQPKTKTWLGYTYVKTNAEPVIGVVVVTTLSTQAGTSSSFAVMTPGSLLGTIAAVYTNTATDATGIAYNFMATAPSQALWGVSSSCGTQLLPGQSCTVTIRLYSTNMGQWTTESAGLVSFANRVGTVKTLYTNTTAYAVMVASPVITARLWNLFTVSNPSVMTIPTTLATQAVVTTGVVVYTNTATQSTAIASNFMVQGFQTQITQTGLNTCSGATLLPGHSCSVGIEVLGTSWAAYYVVSGGTVTYKNLNNQNVAQIATPNIKVLMDVRFKDWYISSYGRTYAGIDLTNRIWYYVNVSVSTGVTPFWDAGLLAKNQVFPINMNGIKYKSSLTLNEMSFCFIDSNDDAYCVGKNRFGALGINNFDIENIGGYFTSVPVKVFQDVSLMTKVTQVLCKDNTCYGLGMNKQVYGWGNAGAIPFGNNLQVDQMKPVKVGNINNNNITKILKVADDAFYFSIFAKPNGNGTGLFGIGTNNLASQSYYDDLVDISGNYDATFLNSISSDRITYTLSDVYVKQNGINGRVIAERFGDTQNPAKLYYKGTKFQNYVSAEGYYAYPYWLNGYTPGPNQTIANGNWTPTYSVDMTGTPVGSMPITGQGAALFALDPNGGLWARGNNHTQAGDYSLLGIASSGQVYHNTFQQVTQTVMPPIAKMANLPNNLDPSAQYNIFVAKDGTVWFIGSFVGYDNSYSATNILPNLNYTVPVRINNMAIDQTVQY
jgi:hypothetical protein